MSCLYQPREVIEQAFVLLDNLPINDYLIRVNAKQSEIMKEFLEANGKKIASNTFLYVCCSIPLVIEVTKCLVKLYPYWRY